MQAYRFQTATPLRIIKRAPSTTRTMAFCTPYSRVSRRSHPFFPAVQQEFLPVFRMFDELENLSRAAPIRTFQPRFDVREEKDSFHLHGELPGVSQDNINIEFTDESTLVIRGKTVRERQSGTAPSTATVEDAPESKAIEQQADDAAETASVSSGISSNYHQPTVEDDADATTTGAPTPATTVAETAKPAELEQQQQQQVSKPAQDDSHYWVRERSIGEFSRSFNFPGHVDQDAVTASLKNGILSIIVPKVQPKQPRRIVVQ